jgi:hypothetical protein
MPPNTGILLYVEPCENPVDKIRFELREKYCRWCNVKQNEGRSAACSVDIPIIEHTEGQARPSYFKHFEPKKKRGRFVHLFAMVVQQLLQHRC